MGIQPNDDITASGGARVLVREVIAGERSQPGEVLAYRDLVDGESVRVGREGDLVLGLDPPDPGLSRIGLTITATTAGWELHFSNRNGATVHPWAQAQLWSATDSKLNLCWPRVGVRLLGGERTYEHWVLLEADHYVLPNWTPTGDDATATVQGPRPRELTLLQRATVLSIFESHLAWPPVASPTARSLDAAAHRLGVTSSAVRERLKPVQQRADELGLHGQYGVTEPEYLFHLALHGYFADVPAGISVAADT